MHEHIEKRIAHTPANDGLRQHWLESSDGLDPDASDIGATTKIDDELARRERGQHSIYSAVPTVHRLDQSCGDRVHPSLYTVGL